MASIDWLQVTCTSQTVLQLRIGDHICSKFPDRWGNHREYTIHNNTEVIMGYCKQCCVRWKGVAILHVGYIPKQQDIDVKAVNIKVANHMLYTSDWYFTLNDFCMNLRIAIKQITRLDLALDFNYFVNGLHPETFIRKYLSGGRTYIRVGSNKWCSMGLKELHHNCYDYLRFGSRQSGVCVYLYNKTRELTQKKDKPYIRNCWQTAQLNTDKDVWRLEFSLTSQGIGLKDIKTTLFDTIFVDQLTTQENIEQLTLIYAKKYFRFKKVDPKIQHKKDMPDVDLLPQPTEPQVKPASIYRKTDTGRTEKAHINYLNHCIDHLSVSDNPNKYEDIKAVQHVVEMLESMYADKRSASHLEQAITSHFTQQYQPDRYLRQLEAMKTNAFIKANRQLLTDLLKDLETELNHTCEYLQRDPEDEPPIGAVECVATP